MLYGKYSETSLEEIFPAVSAATSPSVTANNEPTSHLVKCFVDTNFQETSPRLLSESCLMLLRFSLNSDDVDRLILQGPRLSPKATIKSQQTTKQFCMLLCYYEENTPLHSVTSYLNDPL